MGLDVDDATLKALQADNFDNLNAVVADTPYDKHMRFFNFGYRPLGDEEPAGPRLGAGFPNRDSAQLLFQVIGDTDLTDRSVVEVGCGRGGNLWLLRRSFDVGPLTGIDIAYRSIAYCRDAQPGPENRFAVGDAERVPLRSASTDVVLSVETSCTYPRIESFFREVARMLKVGGQFLYTDLMATELVPAFTEVLEALGLRLDHQRNITANVAASRAERAERQRLAYGKRPDSDDTAMGEFVGQDGSQLYDFLTDGKHSYTILRFTKIAEVDPPATDLMSPEAQDLVRAQASLAVELLSIPSLPSPQG